MAGTGPLRSPRLPRCCDRVAPLIFSPSFTVRSLSFLRLSLPLLIVLLCASCVLCVCVCVCVSVFCTRLSVFLFCLSLSLLLSCYRVDVCFRSFDSPFGPLHFLDHLFVVIWHTAHCIHRSFVFRRLPHMGLHTTRDILRHGSFSYHFACIYAPTPSHRTQTHWFLFI